MLSAVDKLHKLYSTTAEPVVWARSVGVEVLNELDTLKTALMVTAGSQQLNRSVGGVDLGLAAHGLETVATGLNSVKVAGEIASGMMWSGIQKLMKN